MRIEWCKIFFLSLAVSSGGQESYCRFRGRYYTKEEFGVQTCSKCLQWMPEELFRDHEVDNQTISIHRSLITYNNNKFDILNPLSFKFYSEQATDYEKRSFLSAFEHFFKDPIDAVSHPYKEQPENPGKFIWLTGPPGLGKSTSAQLLARKAGYVYYEGDCFGSDEFNYDRDGGSGGAGHRSSGNNMRYMDDRSNCRKK